MNNSLVNAHHQIVKKYMHIPDLQQEFSRELVRIAEWWLTHATDHEHGGFYGEIHNDNSPQAHANKSAILNARILWFFSETACHLPDPRYRHAATRAYHYFCTHFLDHQHGGVYWALDYQGEPIDTKKMIYAQAFAIYGLSAYYTLTQDSNALESALSIFQLIETHALDLTHGGYASALTRDWQPLADVRLADDDFNFARSQNTHLHVLEAYTKLYEIYPTTLVKKALKYTVALFEHYFINRDNHHLRTFCDEVWKDCSPSISYGHDIEASWLIHLALDALGDADYKRALAPQLLHIVDSCLREAFDPSGYLVDEFDYTQQCQKKHFIWWVQAEALVGFAHAYSITGNKVYLTAVDASWRFIKRYQLDKQHGEWFWQSQINATHAHYKAGFWKCPYHNGRAMIASVRYLSTQRMPLLEPA